MLIFITLLAMIYRGLINNLLNHLNLISWHYPFTVHVSANHTRDLSR